MSTLIEVRKSDGRIVGRCDAKCYQATEPKCTCICGGMNHGVGYKQAIQNNTDKWQKVIDLNEGNQVTKCCHQMGLFDEK